MKREKKFCPQGDIFLSFPFIHSSTTHIHIPLSGSILYPPCSELLPPEFLLELPALNMPAGVFSLPPRLLLPYYRLLVQILFHKTNQQKFLRINRQLLLLLLPCKCIALSSNVSYPTTVANFCCELDSSVMDLQNPARAVPSLQPRSPEYCHAHSS